MRAAFIVAGLGFGDEGKGTTVDWLVRRHNASLVVRYNGGAQAAHNVVLPDGRHHTFAQFGSGTLAGVATFLSRHMLINPSAMLNEAEHLSALGMHEPLAHVFVDEDALVTTPFHVATNRAREAARGAGRHGSCGMGIRETVADAEDPARVSISVHDLWVRGELHRKLFAVQEQKLNDALAAGPLDLHSPIGHVLTNGDVIHEVVERMAAWVRSVQVVGSEWLGHRLRGFGGPVVFEGAQGVLLDPQHGYFPHVTATNCTYHNALGLLAAADHESTVTRLAVTRTYQTRHGAGPLPSEDPSLQHLLGDDHNAEGQWQGGMRAGQLDLGAAERASKALKQIDGLVVTHADKVDTGVVPVCVAYNCGDAYDASKHAIQNMSIDQFAERIGTRVALVSSGATYLDKVAT